MKVGNGWHIQHAPKPIPNRNYDYDFWHNDNDEDLLLCGEGASFEDCISKIAEITEEHPYFNEEE